MTGIPKWGRSGLAERETRAHEDGPAARGHRRRSALAIHAARAEAAGGSNLLGEFTPDYDYALVRRFREAGFALVGKTQTPEYVPAGAALTPRRSRGDRLRG